MIPLIDLAAQHAAVADEIAQGWQQVISDTAFVGGPQITTFEREYAEFVGARHCIGVGNGTDAIEIALRALGVGPGSECILPANTFVATAEAVIRTGAVPVLVDCADDGTYLIDSGAVEAAVTSRTRVILPVHLYGQAAPVERLLPLAKRIGAQVVEDAAQAQGARRNGLNAGTLGHAAATSFYPGKNLGAYGDAGAVLTGSEDVAARVRMIRDHGSRRKYEHEICGLNSRMDTLQAVVLSAKLHRLEGWNAARREAAARYDSLLSQRDDIARPHSPGWQRACLASLRYQRPRPGPGIERIACGRNRSRNPLSRTHPPYSGIRHTRIRGGRFSRRRARARTIISLPIFPEITAEQQEQVVSALIAALS